MKISEQLTKKIKTLLDVFVIEQPRRTYASWYWRNQGAWVWIAKVENKQGQIFNVGSTDTMKDCIKAPKLSYHRPIPMYHDVEIHAEEETNQEDT